MTASQTVMNFNPGPATLPRPALERAQRELLDFDGTGMSVMEHSHRGTAYEAVHDEAIRRLRELLDVPSEYDVLFMQGGASQQFAQVPQNLLQDGGTADYVVTGAWGEKALAEARIVARGYRATIGVAADTASGEGKNKTWRRVPAASEIATTPGASYVHLTSNETIHGVQFRRLPELGVPMVCDMSSDFLSRRLDVRPFGMIYAGAQKNVGPSGVVLVLVRKEWVASARGDIPLIYQYRTAASSNSLYNTPPTFGIYLVRNVLAWMQEVGGLDQIAAWNAEKAGLIYAAINAYPDLYRCPVQTDSRSEMNVVFRLPDQEQEDRFVAEAERRQMVGLRGHRSVGGIRVSLYNAVPVAWADALATMMRDFARAGA